MSNFSDVTCDVNCSCENCCEHEFDASEGFHCLNCGKDGSEEVQCRAYDILKDE